VKAVAKAKILEITLSVIGTAEDGYPEPDMVQIASTAGLCANDMNADLAGRTMAEGASSESLVISVRIRGATSHPRYRPRSGGWM
jgi:hypothetical protein